MHGRPRVGVQLDRRTEGHPGVGRADEVDVAQVSTGAVLSVVEADEVAVSHRLAPAHVPPVVGAEHADEVAVRGAVHAPHRRERRRADDGAGPGGAAVCRAEHHVLPGGQAAALLVHCRHVDPATAR